MPKFVEVIIPTAVPGSFTYSVPEGHAERVRTGSRVVVNFGSGRKLYSAVVRSVHEVDPGLPRIKSVLSVLDATPIVNDRQLELWSRIAEHYMCTLGEVMVAALPGGLVLTSETRLISNGTVTDNSTGDTRADLLLDALERQHELRLADAAELLGLKDPMPVIKPLLDRGALLIAEELSEGTPVRTERFVHLTEASKSEEALHEWFDRLTRAPRSLALLMKYVELSRCLEGAAKDVKREYLLRASGGTSAQLNKLVEKGLFLVEERLADAAIPGSETARIPELTAAQQGALEAIRAFSLNKDVALLQGVTSSGKTEVYMELIAEALAQGRQALYLLPEIALTSQVISRLRTRFGGRVAVYHSRLSPRDRATLWNGMLADPSAYPLVVGARSALFLPFNDLGLVVVDEEHDTSYKQQEPAPRYHARDMAIVLASIHNGKALLGSATPSMESRYNAESGKYGYARLLERFGDSELPVIERIDLNDARKRKQMQGSFTTRLVDAITQAITRKEQAIVFQNRRGYVPVWQCETCGWIPECEHCDASLTYHKQQHDLRCHYCGREYPPPARCSACGSARLRMIGIGTEKIEEELALLLPHATIARMDQDTTRGKNAFDRILGRFGEGGIDVLVGTQMVTKGLDFEQVTVVGIINADHLLGYPDFRAHERAFQLMSQVAGRSGRRGKRGTVFIQAKGTEHPVIKAVVAHDTDGMYHRELEHRFAHGYPPFTRAVRFTLKHRSEERVQATAEVFARAMRPHFGVRVLGPEPPIVPRIRDKHLRNILVKLERQHYRDEKALLSDLIDQLFADPMHRAVRLVIDVDPS